MSEILKQELTSMNIKEAQLEKLKSIFPEVFTEGLKVDWEKLKLTLGESVDVGKERYGMMWPGKAECFKTIQEPSIGTLVPCREESVDFDNTQNLFIEGDNLEVLKLLQNSYLGKIKMIYIDPPYNTGKEFIYPDNYSESLDTYLEYTGQVDGSGKKFGTNTETDGRFHSKWLNMMYPRLMIAKNLLKDDGVIFISIDDNEIGTLRMICNEIFGEENFIVSITVNRTSEIATNNVIQKHEYCLVYAKSTYAFSVKGKEKYTISRGTVGNPDQTMPIIEFPAGLKCVSIPDGIYKETRKIEGSSENIENFDEIKVKGGVLEEPVRFKAKWRSSNDMRNFFNNNCNPTPAKISGLIEEIYFEGDRFMPQIKKATYEKIPSIIDYNKRGSEELESLGLGGLFDFPKSTSLLKPLIALISKPKDSDIILDFFAGSSTLAHSVMELNSTDGGNRKFICIQLPEPYEEGSKAKSFGFNNIADVSKERIRRAGSLLIGKKNKEDKLIFNGDEASKQDFGFRCFKLTKSNFKIWDNTTFKESESFQSRLFDFVENISSDANQESILFELLIKSGFKLTTSIDKLLLNNKIVYSIEESQLLICLEEELTEKCLNQMAEMRPSRVICLDRGFTGTNADALKTNAVQIMKSRGVLSFRTI